MDLRLQINAACAPFYLHSPYTGCPSQDFRALYLGYLSTDFYEI
jgi:hypothetical protein